MSKQYSNLGFNSDYQSKHVTLDDITFNNVKHVDTGHTQRLGRGTWSTLETSGTLTDNSFSVNAVDIDWNGAEVQGALTTSVTLNTTGDTLKWIEDNFLNTWQLIQAEEGKFSRYVPYPIKNNNPDKGTNGQVLTSTGSGTQWKTLPTFDYYSEYGESSGGQNARIQVGGSQIRVNYNHYSSVSMISDYLIHSKSPDITLEDNVGGDSIRVIENEFINNGERNCFYS